MQVLGQLVGKLGRAIEPHLGSVMPALVDKLSDNKIVVQQHDVKVSKQCSFQASQRLLPPCTCALSPADGSWPQDSQVS